MEGYGTFRFSDGKVYAGFYKGDKKEGFGVFTWNNGKQYKGNWFSGKQHGLGLFSDGKTWKAGIWSEGQREKWLDEGEFIKEELEEPSEVEELRQRIKETVDQIKDMTKAEGEKEAAVNYEPSEVIREVSENEDEEEE